MDIEDFKNRHLNEEVIVFGSGPSLNNYNNSLDDGKILIGTNEMVYYHKLMDYYFIGDAGDHHRGYLNNPKKYDSYQPKIQKFYRNIDKYGRLRPAEMPKNQDGVIYYDVIQKTGYRFFDTIPPFSDALSITFEALQFALMCGFTTIYLIGHDCNYINGSFRMKHVGATPIQHAPEILKSWKMFSKLIDNHYKHVKIINVNPVRMKLFHIMNI